MILNAKWALKLLRTKSFIIITDTEAICNIPLIDLEKLDNVVMLTAQTSQLLAIMEQLSDIGEKHKKRLEEMMEVQRNARETLREEEANSNATKPKTRKKV